MKRLEWKEIGASRLKLTKRDSRVVGDSLDNSAGSNFAQIAQYVDVEYMEWPPYKEELRYSEWIIKCKCLPSVDEEKIDGILYRKGDQGYKLLLTLVIDNKFYFQNVLIEKSIFKEGVLEIKLNGTGGALQKRDLRFEI